MPIFAEMECHFSAVSIAVYTALIHHFTCRLEARQALIYQLALGLTGENGRSAFLHCTGLASVDIPASVAGIGPSAFLDCTGLKRVDILGSATMMGENAFKGCPDLIIHAPREESRREVLQGERHRVQGLGLMPTGSSRAAKMSNEVTE